jgi:predicted DNA-binding transcriptional regulator AlpA
MFSKNELRCSVQSTTDVLERFMTRKEVERAIGKRTAWIYSAMKAGRFPRPARDGRSVRWLERDIVSYQQRCIAARETNV